MVLVILILIITFYKPSKYINKYLYTIVYAWKKGVVKMTNAELKDLVCKTIDNNAKTYRIGKKNLMIV
jgi:hypothetical protein